MKIGDFQALVDSIMDYYKNRKNAGKTDWMVEDVLRRILVGKLLLRNTLR